MGVITKVYTFIDNIVADASEVNRNFDDLYTLVNGNIDSANIVATFTMDSTQVNINDTAANFSSCKIEGALEEVYNSVIGATRYPKGYNGLHILPKESAAINVFPGAIEVNGTICYVQEKISACGITLYDSESILASMSYYLLVGSAISITASDIFLARVSNVTIAISGTDTQGSSIAEGVYYGNKRVFGSVYNQDTLVGHTEAFIDSFCPHGPTTAFAKKLTNEEISYINGFRHAAGASADISLATGDCSVIYMAEREYDKNTKLYSYNVIFRANSASGDTMVWSYMASPHTNFATNLENVEIALLSGGSQVYHPPAKSQYAYVMAVNNTQAPTIYSSYNTVGNFAATVVTVPSSNNVAGTFWTLYFKIKPVHTSGGTIY